MTNILHFKASDLLHLIRVGRTSDYTVVEDKLIHNTGTKLFYNITIRNNTSKFLFKGNYCFAADKITPREITFEEYKKQYNENKDSQV